MKKIILFALFLISFMGFSQEFSGTYFKKNETVDTGFFEYKLHLNDNFTYEIFIQRKINKNSEIEYFKGLGTWKQEKHKIVFYPENTGVKNEIDMTSVTARFDVKKKDELLFYTKKRMSWNLNVGMRKQ